MESQQSPLNYTVCSVLSTQPVNIHTSISARKQLKYPVILSHRLLPCHCILWFVKHPNFHFKIFREASAAGQKLVCNKGLMVETMSAATEKRRVPFSVSGVPFCQKKKRNREELSLPFAWPASH